MTSRREGAADRADDVIVLRPGLAGQLRHQTALPGNDEAIVDQNVELTVAAFLQFNRHAHLISNQRSVTRRVVGNGGSRRAVNDSNAHRRIIATC